VFDSESDAKSSRTSTHAHSLVRAAKVRVVGSNDTTAATLLSGVHVVSEVMALVPFSLRNPFSNPKKLKERFFDFNG
jgi:hypothetical protein